MLFCTWVYFVWSLHPSDCPGSISPRAPSTSKSDPSSDRGLLLPSTPPHPGSNRCHTTPDPIDATLDCNLWVHRLWCLASHCLRLQTLSPGPASELGAFDSNRRCLSPTPGLQRRRCFLGWPPCTAAQDIHDTADCNDGVTSVRPLMVPPIWMDPSVCHLCNQRDVIMFRPPIEHPPSTFCHHQRSCTVALP
jgi:hypothetical protein